MGEQALIHFYDLLCDIVGRRGEVNLFRDSKYVYVQAKPWAKEVRQRLASVFEEHNLLHGISKTSMFNLK